MKGPEGICGATCALLYTFLLLPPPFKERKKEVKRISIRSLLHNNPKFYFDQIGVAYTCTASRWLYHNMSKSHSWVDGNLSITSRCWSLSRSPTRLCLSVVWRNDTHNGVVTSGQTICHQYWLCFLLYDCSIEEEEKKTNNQKCSTCCVCVCLSRHSIACAPGPCNPSWTLFLYYMMKTFTSSPPLLPWYSPLFFYVTSIKRRWIKNK